MGIDTARARDHLRDFDLTTLFVEELGWDRLRQGQAVEVDGRSFELRPVAEKRGVQVFRCAPDAGGKLPDYATRRKIEQRLTKLAFEHLVVYVDGAETTQVWQWVKREPGRPTACREHVYHAGQSGDSLLQQLERVTFPLSAEEGLTLGGVTVALRDAFDKDRVTKRFYDRFKNEHAAFLDFVKGIRERGDAEWYASLMLNRLMFVYFIQKKGFLDGDPDYLRNRLRWMRERQGDGRFLSFYRHFLLRLFHDGLGGQERDGELDALLGTVPYLNGGLFDVHELERNYPEIEIPDEAFAALFDFFDEYTWHLDERPLRDGREINPDVLGYIFEKYVNQKQMGAYYTKEDITGYISRNTIVPFLFDAAKKECAIAFRPEGALWRLLRDDPDRYIYPAVRTGVIGEDGEVIPLPAEIAAGLDDVGKRGGWNRPADAAYALPTETWRELVARRTRCLELRAKLAAGEVHEINDLITHNLDIVQFAQDAIEGCEGPELLRAFFTAIREVTVLDPTCGSGAFLFAALNILDPLYDACLDRMQAFVADLEQSDEPHSPRKFSDFRETLAEVAKHPNRPSFVLKSIVLNNLYGVDIMEEAVEICKLRLFLKLVAQVERADQIEPLPDIDFNIRAGNTLVGFATRADVEASLTFGRKGQRRMLSAGEQETVRRIEESAEVADRAFQKFHEMQTQHGMNSQSFTEAKGEVRRRLRELAEELDQYLSEEYGVGPTSNVTEEARTSWRARHHPFHWFVEFYGIMQRGGFDVVVGNPPYIEYSRIRSSYSLLSSHFSVASAGNLYAFVIERCIALTSDLSRMGMIVQLSAICTDRMEPLQGLYKRSAPELWASCFDDRPGKLFDGLEHIRATIILNSRGFVDRGETWTTNLLRWHAETRDHLFPTLVYGPVEHLLVPGSFPKAHESSLRAVVEKVRQLPETLATIHVPRSQSVVYYYRSPLYWIRSMDFLPHFDSGQATRSLHHFKDFGIADESFVPVVGSIINSSLFYLWFVTYGNGRNVALRDIETFPVPTDLFEPSSIARLTMAFDDLMKDYQRHSVIRRRRDGVEYQEFYPAYSKAVIDNIDEILANHYGFTDKDLDYIVNFDIKYRMGREAEAEG